jgi:curved DNA-binding protein CbpA
VSTRVRDWAEVDFYDLLGVHPDATGDDIARAFRVAAKRTHPDATDDPVAAERFKDLSAAYAVLSNRRTRRDYDQVRAGVAFVAPPRAAGSTNEPVVVRRAPSRPAARKPWSRRKAWTAVIAGAIVTLLGVAATILTIGLHEHDAQRRAHDVAVTAKRLADGEISFTTRTGERIVTKEPEQHGDPGALGPTVNVRYDPNDAHHVIVDANTLGRDITFGIVALKLLIGGPVFVVLGTRRLRKIRSAR